MNEELIQPGLWAITIGVALLFGALALLVRRRGGRTRPFTLVVLGALVAAALVVPAIGVVPAGHRGVVYEWSGGVSKTERGEGIAILVPWAQRMRSISVRTQKVFSDKVFSQSSDLQEITVVASINYHVDPSKAAELYQRVGDLYPNTVIQPALFQRTKAAIGQVKAEDFALGRANLAETIQIQLSKQLSPYGIVVEFVNVEDAIFDKDFIAAVKAKIIAEQKAAEQRRLIEAERAIKEQTIIKAEADAKAIQIKADADAYANLVVAQSITPEILRWKWLVTWNGQVPTTLAGADAGVLLGVYP